MGDPILNECINPTCPICGKPVDAASLTFYRDHTVGFCAPDCRDEFAADPDDFPDAKVTLDQRITDQSS